MVCALFYVWNLYPPFSGRKEKVFISLYYLIDGFMMGSYKIRNAWGEISAIAAIFEVSRLVA